MTIFNHSRGEFSNSLSCGMLLPYMWKKAGHQVKVITRMVLPREWTRGWFDELVYAKKNGQKGEYHTKRDIEQVVLHKGKIESNPDHVASLPLPPMERPCSEDYVVLIPTIYGHGGDVFHARTVTAARFQHWKDIANYIRSYGLKVVCFSACDSSTRKQLEQIGDITFFADREDLEPKNKFLAKQLPWMQHAITSVAVGGACHLQLTFEGIPGIIYDGQLYTNYKRFCWILKNKRGDLRYLSRVNDAAKKHGCLNYMKGPDHPHRLKLQEAYRDEIIKHLKEIMEERGFSSDPTYEQRMKQHMETEV